MKRCIDFPSRLERSNALKVSKPALRVVIFFILNSGNDLKLGYLIVWVMGGGEEKLLLCEIILLYIMRKH